MHLFSDWLLSLKLANALVKQSAQTIDHCMGAETRCVCIARRGRCAKDGGKVSVCVCGGVGGVL